jgi:hypothetical protein
LIESDDALSKGGAIAKAATALADLERRVARQEAQRDLDAQYPARKTAVR